MRRVLIVCIALVAVMRTVIAEPIPETDAIYAKVRANLASADKNLNQASGDIAKFIALAPTDERGGELLFRLGNAQTDETKKVIAYSRVFTDYPASTFAQPARGAIRRIAGVGKPFELDFTDAITAKNISIQRDFKGKVIVISFWASWCSDCLADTPRMKALYDQYKDKGVQFVGVSVDKPESEGGLTSMKQFIAKHGIEWPQYYQGNYFQSEFSAGWGVNSTPSAFVLDKQGNLHSYNAQKDLEKIIPDLLAK